MSICSQEREQNERPYSILENQVKYSRSSHKVHVFRVHTLLIMSSLLGEDISLEKKIENATMHPPINRKFLNNGSFHFFPFFIVARCCFTRQLFGESRVVCVGDTLLDLHTVQSNVEFRM